MSLFDDDPGQLCPFCGEPEPDFSPCFCRVTRSDRPDNTRARPVKAPFNTSMRVMVARKLAKQRGARK